MKEKNNKTNTLLLTVIAVATLMVAVIGATFAYFTASTSGGESASTIKLAAGLLKIDFADGSESVLLEKTNIEPSTDPIITKTFTVTGTNTTTGTTMPYSLSLVVQNNTFRVNNNDGITSTDPGYDASNPRIGGLAYTLESTNNDNNGTVATSVSTRTDIPYGASTVALGNGNFTTATSKKHTYVLKIYFYNEADINQDVNKVKSFAAYVKVESQEITTN